MKLRQEFLKWFEKWFKRKTKQQIVTSDKPVSIGRRPQKIHFQVGLDFGTSSTKIAYSQLGGRGKRVRPILFNHQLPHYPSYCLPSVGAFDDSGNLLLGVEAARYLSDKPWDEGLRRFKVLVAGKYDTNFYDKATVDSYRNHINHVLSNRFDCEPEHLTAAFLAFAMRQARLAIQQEFDGYELDLAFNICVPIDYIQNNKVQTIFETILATAEATEMIWDDDNLNNLLKLSREKYQKSTYKPEDEKTRVFAVAEAVAEVASYLVSLQVRDGLHAVIDFGAGTTDCSIFNLHNARDTNSTTYWYSARNIPRGTYRIERIIADFLQPPDGVLSELQLLKALEDISQWPPALQQRVRKELYSLWEASHQVWREAYGHLRNQAEWEKDKVQVFICGGGSKLPFVKEIFRNSWMKEWGPYQISTLPIPDDYESFSNKAPFERLSVAYGLTQPLPTFGKFILPADSPDHTPPPLPVREIDWWERVPRPDWLGPRRR